MKAVKKYVVLAIVGILGVTAKILVKVGIYGSLLAISHFLHISTDSDSTQSRSSTVAQGKPGAAASRAQKPSAPTQTAPSNQPPVLIGNGPIGAGPKAAAANAAAAANRQLASQTGQEVPTPRGAAAPPPQSSPSAPPQQRVEAPAPEAPPASQVVQQGAPATGKPGPNTGKAVPTIASAAPVLPGRSAARADSITARRAADTTKIARSLVMREIFDYGRDARRDPFVSLMTTGDLRPTITDLRLTGILYDLSGSRPIAVLRDVAGGQWRVTTGMTLGRMRVAFIRPKAVIFTIEEFGFNRQDSLLLGDTTRVRVR